MKRLLTAGIFGTILGIVGAGTANASIVSSGFLDEKLTEYALSTSLDLKANQSDLTALSNKIGTLPTELDLHTRDFTFMFNNIRKVELPADYPLSQFMIDILFGNVINGVQMPGLQNIIGVIMNGGYLNESWGGYQYMGLPDLSRNLGTPYLVENEGYVLNRTEFPFSTELFPDLEPQNKKFDTSIIEYLEQDLLDIRSPTLAGVTNKLLNGWTDAKGGYIINPGLKGMYEGWTIDGHEFPGLYNLSVDESRFTENFGATVSSILTFGQEKFTSQEYTGPIYPLWKLSQGIDQIGTLPTGELPISPNTWGGFLDGMELYNRTKPTYPTSLAELIKLLFSGDEKLGIIPAIYSGVPVNVDDQGAPKVVGVLRNYQLASGAKELATTANTTANTANETANAAKSTAQANAVKIGDLPSGNFPMFPGYEFLFYELDQPLTYPTSLAELINAIYGDAKNSKMGLMKGIIAGFPFYDTDGNGSLDEPVGLIPNYNLAKTANDIANANTAKIGTVPDGQTVAGMATTAKTTADSAIEKIGTLPTEYATVGAALSAIKGIAEEAKTAALAAIPDPKTEGATGKYVLTVDIIDSSATPVYRWEKIDRESEPTTTE